MAQALAPRRYSQTDRGYNALCENNRHWRLALGGDSHGRNICDAMQRIIGYEPFEGGVRLNCRHNFAQGGLQVMNYEGSDLFNTLRVCSAEIILIHIGGNDIDMQTRRHRRDVIYDLLSIFVNLEQSGKICYIVGLPNRHSTRHQDIEEMQRDIKYINRKLKQFLIGRFIALPTPCWPIESFKPSWYRPRNQPMVPEIEERVHLFPEIYDIAAEHILERLNNDLHGRLSPLAELRAWLTGF